EFTKVPRPTTHGGHFNMAENRTFLLCVDRRQGRRKIQETRKQNAGVWRLFYCIPIGNGAYRCGHPIGATGEHDGRTSGRLAGNAGLDGAENVASPGSAARLWDCAPYRTDQRRPARRELWNALPGPSEAR